MNPETFKPTLRDYCLLMENIKFRTELMRSITKDSRGLPVFAVAELLHLQIRIICETMALACLTAHRNLEGARSSRLQSAYQADHIMNALERLHPRFYPRPLEQILRDGKVIGIKDITEGFLTKPELLRSYYDAAGYLHAGAMTKLKERKMLDLNSISAWGQKLVRLLNHHTIYLADTPDAWEGKEPLKFSDGEPAPKFQMIAQMATGTQGRPAATIFQAVGQMPTPP